MSVKALTKTGAHGADGSDLVKVKATDEGVLVTT